MWITKSMLAEPRLQALFDADETVQTALTAGVAMSGVERIVEPPRPEPEDSGKPLTGLAKGAAIVGAAAANAVTPTGWSGGDLPLRALGGTRVAGTADSQGVRLFRALQGSTSSLLVVTDRRLLFASTDLVPVPDETRSTKRRLVQEFAQRAAVRRDDVVGARRRGRLGAVGRVELYFRDGSMAALMTGILSPRPALKLVRSLGGPRTPAAG
jgi:hypothetical protein